MFRCRLGSALAASPTTGPRPNVAAGVRSSLLARAMWSNSRRACALVAVEYFRDGQGHGLPKGSGRRHLMLPSVALGGFSHGGAFEWRCVRTAVLLGALAVVAAAGLLCSAAVAEARSLGGDPLVPTAHLGAVEDAPIPLGDVAVSGDTIVASGSAYLGGQVRQVLYVFTRPAGGWSGDAKCSRS